MKFAGFALLAAGFAFALHALNPKSFDPGAAAPTAELQAFDRPEPVRLAIARNFAVSATELPASSPGDTGLAVSLPAVVALPNLPSASVAVVSQVDETPNRTTLVRRIQRELRRVGCFDGRIDGEWDGSLRAAMGQFIDRVNATLPYQEPDVVLLNLVRNHKAVACGLGCPDGQTLDGSGRCLPHAVVAKAHRKSGVKVVAQAAPSAWTTTVTVNEVRPTAATLPAPAPPAKAPQLASRTPKPAPLPGRMAMGGPQTEKATPSNSNWWETFVTPSSSSDSPVREQTLDRPVGLTHVPQPRLVRREATPLPGNGQQQASLAPMTGADGAGDGAAMVPVEAKPLAEQSPPPRAGKSYRKAGKAKSRQRYSNRSRRNVQALFQHPLGRM